MAGYGGRDSAVGIATGYGLDGPGIESRWERDFLHPYLPALGPPSLLYNGYWVFHGGKAAGAWLWQPTLCSADVKERLELYFYSPGPSWPVTRWTLPLPCTWLSIGTCDLWWTVGWKNQISCELRSVCVTFVAAETQLCFLGIVELNLSAV